MIVNDLLIIYKGAYREFRDTLERKTCSVYMRLRLIGEWNKNFQVERQENHENCNAMDAIYRKMNLKSQVWHVFFLTFIANRNWLSLS